MDFEQVEEGVRQLAALFISRCFEIFAEAVDAKSLGIVVLPVTHDLAVLVNRPVEAAEFPIPKSRFEIVKGVMGDVQIFLLPRHQVSLGEGPEEAGAGDGRPRHVVADRQVVGDSAVKAAVFSIRRMLHPEGEDVLIKLVFELGSQEISFHWGEL